MDRPAVTIEKTVHHAYREVAVEHWAGEKLQIDDDAKVSESDMGAWVQAWVWVDGLDLTVLAESEELASRP